jgi:hypothetical protein
VHGGSLDVFDIAAHYYFSGRDYGPPCLRWDLYEAVDVRYACGVATGSEAAGVDAASIEAVEAMPSFQGWAKRPAIGVRAAATVDCLSMPWAVVLMAKRGADLDGDEARVRELLARPPRAASPRVAVAKVKGFAARASKLLRWQIERWKAPLGTSQREAVRRAQRRVVRKLQQSPITRRYDGRLHELTPRGVAVVAQMLDWAESYLAEPHPELGREGPICPFIAKTVAANRFLVTVHEESDLTEDDLRDILLSYAHDFQRRYPAKENDMKASLLIVFPNLPSNGAAWLDAIHDEAKTFLMTHRLMSASIHAESKRPAIWNASFPVLRAPIPCFAVRHMVMQDIAFGGHNRVAMMTYDEHFGALFAAKKVSNEFGYVDLYNQARARFGMT